MAAVSEEMTVEIPCCFKNCGLNGSITTDQDRVEVKTFVPDPRLCVNVSFHVNWSPTGDGVFHYACWKALRDPESELSDLEQDMIREASRTAEYHDGMSNMKREAKKIADMLQKAKFAIAFTGAGISTSAGIGDFRGKSGKWTENDRSAAFGAAAKPDEKKSFSYEDLRPTYTHEALAKLVELGYVKHLISQNCDGLHSLSGIPMDRMWELHGNVFHERCDTCQARKEWPHCVRYYRGGQTTRCQRCHGFHYTGNKCSQLNCSGGMMDTVINFGDALETHVLGGAQENAEKNDFVLCLGTTLRVSPANSLVEAGQRPIRLAICNRQPTPCDNLCYERGPDGQAYGSRVFGDCDPLMREIMMHILGPATLESWENGRADRMRHYNTKRIC